jgi:hypothetical protein
MVYNSLMHRSKKVAPPWVRFDDIKAQASIEQILVRYDLLFNETEE